jgi:hypothetical protein
MYNIFEGVTNKYTQKFKKCMNCALPAGRRQTKKMHESHSLAAWRGVGGRPSVPKHACAVWGTVPEEERRICWATSARAWALSSFLSTFSAAPVL